MLRFPVEAAAVASAPSDEDSWNISSSTSQAFRSLADSVCVALTSTTQHFVGRSISLFLLKAEIFLYLSSI